MFSATSNRCPESISPMSFLDFSNLSYVLSQTCPKMCPRPDMSQTRPGHVPYVSSKFPCTDHFGTYPNISRVNLFLCPLSISQTCPMSFPKLVQKCVPGRTCPRRVLDMSRTCPQNFPVLTILVHLQIGRLQLRYWLSIISIKKLKLHFIQTNIWTNKFQYITRYWHYRTATKPSILSCIHEETRFNCYIKFPILSGE